MKISKNRYLQGFGLVVIVLAVLKTCNPSLGENGTLAEIPVDSLPSVDSVVPKVNVEEPKETQKTPISSKFYDEKGNVVKHPILSVSNYSKTFPDTNALQMQGAKRWGVEYVKNRKEAESRKSELVYVGSNPYFFVDKLHSSIPYLVPRASILLNDIGKAFFDSLAIKGVPLNKIIVTSVLRSEEDVAKLRNHNGNATENSCHLYGTTFDICYNRYKPVVDPDNPKKNIVRNDTLKWVLSEVLNDFRNNGRCYVKYEVKQGCYHITVK